MEESLADWDLLAVVRSCAATTTTSSTAELHPPQVKQEPCFSSCSSSELLFGFPAVFQPNTTSLYVGSNCPVDNCDSNDKNTPKFQSFPSSSVIAGGSFGIGESSELRRIGGSSQVVFRAPNNTAGANSQQPQRTKRRKDLIKKVCHVPAEGFSNDMWAWRKYGQKPIKGSPYPRGYYRCSSSKACLARKQVERNRSDPKMFIVTYTAEHNHPMPTHRNSLAGSTRPKPTSSTSAADPPSSPSTASLSPPMAKKSEPKIEGDDLAKELVGDDDMGLSDLMLHDDFYVGFEKIDGEDTDEYFSDQFSPSIELPWLANGSSNCTATAANDV